MDELTNDFLESIKEDDSSSLLAPPVLYFYNQKGGDCIYGIRTGGFLLDSQEFEELVAEWRKFYDHFTDDFIHLHNYKQRDRLYGPRQLDPEQQPSPVKKRVTGFVYLLEADNGYFKIGKAKDVQKRIKGFLKLPFGVKLVHSIASNDYTSAELYLHETFIDSRVNGEWFALTEENVKWIMEHDQLDF